MSHIQMQQQLVSQLERALAGWAERGCTSFYQDEVGKRSKLTRLHAEAMQAKGYTKAEAWESARQCVDMATLNLCAEVPA